MLRLRDFMKEDKSFQESFSKIRLEFPPASTWICFTDAVPHAALSGQFALEQTFLIPVGAMVASEKCPSVCWRSWLAGHWPLRLLPDAGASLTIRF